MTLLPGEEQLVTSNNERIVLTTQRIVMRDIERSYMHSVEIFLEDISSVEVKYTSNVKLLELGVIGVLVFAAFFDSYLKSAVGPGIILMASLVLIGWWWFSRQHIVSISSKGGSPLNFRIDSIPLEKIEAFIDKVQRAKAARVKLLYKL